MGIDRDVVARIRDATNLLDLVGQAVQLRKQGAAWVGRCPFHTERTPSFQVLPDKGFYHCFGCGKHGDAFTWLQEREGLTFGEAMEQLARAAGVDLPRLKQRTNAEIDLESRQRSALDAAQAFYARRLQESSLARDYLESRGISESFAKDAGFGYAPEGFDHLLNHLRAQGFSPELLEQCGLLGRNDRGNLFDFLRHRLTIPIHDARGRLIAFGGRAFGDAQPKYLNTRETALFSKGNILFGFHRAKGQMREGALVVEGYFDVLQLHQQGLHQVVAPMGTALTEGHLQQVARFTKRLVLCFDGDAAGVRAMEKSLRLALPMGFDVRLLILPDGEDPDTWCLKVGSEGFRELILRSPDWTSFVVDRALAGKDFRRIPDRMGALKELAEFLVYLPATVERRELFASLAHQLQIPLQELDRAVKARGPGATVETAAAAAPLLPEPEEVDDLLRPLILLARQADGRAQMQDVPPAWWESLPGAPLLQCVLDAEGDDTLIPETALARIRGLEAVWASRGETELLPEVALLKLQAGYVAREKQVLCRQLNDAAVVLDPALQAQLQKRITELAAREKALGRELRASRSR